MLAGLIGASGCQHGVFTKSAQEECCPTDIRKKHFWCWGEDAVIHSPCGPDEAYYGCKPTCWREWPAPGESWRDEHCGVYEYATHETVVELAPAVATVRAEAPSPELIPRGVAPAAGSPESSEMNDPSNAGSSPESPSEQGLSPEIPPARPAEQQSDNFESYEQGESFQDFPALDDSALNPAYRHLLVNKSSRTARRGKGPVRLPPVDRY
ncbi:hypothetical protein Mal64_11380 [Pseudobythopirellula maris]|uniref:Uncharacterized protein n=2 Tax=Pseudobythopirellula maris TaxID=2527991 RepID=A0A5C5ZUZ7_9BACT|nr:hypothetical protein Mal64_11380 [Pseudobythopirellula maris]